MPSPCLSYLLYLLNHPFYALFTHNFLLLVFGSALVTDK
nr:MAG TPA: hypothetical protein [Caudoviricetes sp.]DAZ63990.1 MAG TPA: hypothetical protein [Caudoviricetes sp.]